MTDSSRSALRGAVAALALLATAGTARAHVRYVTPGSDPVAAVRFLADALTDPFNLLVLSGGALGITLLGLGYFWFRPAAHDVAVLRETLASYRDLLPWLLRLSVGLPLVGAGYLGYFFSPAVEPAFPGIWRLFGVGVGFLLLFGLATRALAAGALLVYLAGLALEPALLLAFEYVPGLLAVVLVGSGRPSADHVLAHLAADDRTTYARLDPVYRPLSVPIVERLDRYRPVVPTILRAGLGFAFCYLGLTQKLMNPGSALAVVAKYDLTAVVPVSPDLWVVGAGLAEILVGVLLLLGAFTRATAGAAFVLFTLTLFGLPDDPVLAHVSLFGLVSALMVTGPGALSLDARLKVARATERTGPAEAD